MVTHTYVLGAEPFLYYGGPSFYIPKMHIGSKRHLNMLSMYRYTGSSECVLPKSFEILNTTQVGLSNSKVFTAFEIQFKILDSRL